VGLVGEMVALGGGVEKEMRCAVGAPQKAVRKEIEHYCPLLK